MTDPTVTLPASVLHTLVLAAELGARVQNEVLGVTQDVMFRRMQPDMRAACDTANRVYSDAVRVRDNPHEGGDPDSKEAASMRKIDRADGQVLRVKDIREYEMLVLKGLAICGSGSLVVKWGDKTTSGLADKMQFVRLTTRGAKWLARNPQVALESRQPPPANPPFLLASV